MSDESQGEALHIRVGGLQLSFTAKNPLKSALGATLDLVGRFPPITFHGEHIAPRSLHLEEVLAPLARVTTGLAGLRIGLITDMHHEPHRPVALLARAVALLNAAAPDVILLGGDYVNSTARDFDRPLALLATLRAPLGVYGVLGNHDYWAGGDYLAARLAGAGITVLRNEARHLRAPGGDGWWLAGGRLDGARPRRPRRHPRPNLTGRVLPAAGPRAGGGRHDRATRAGGRFAVIRA